MKGRRRREPAGVGEIDRGPERRRLAGSHRFCILFFAATFSGLALTRTCPLAPSATKKRVTHRPVLREYSRIGCSSSPKATRIGV